MGVFYPVHVVLYGCFGTELAYVISLVLHTLWGALGTFWLARRLGISALGSVLAAFSWSACGFFMIHLAHPWSYTTGCWMPWAWGLAWHVSSANRSARRFAPLLLALVLSLQVLPGHFQLAFICQVVVLLSIFWGGGELLWQRVFVRVRRSGRSLPPSSPTAVGPVASAADAASACEPPHPAGAWARHAVGCVLAVAAVFPLTAIQLWPTARLASLAADQRNFGYLSGFALSPFHLVNFVAPGLFHQSPLWRPIIWDPFHTSPEEHLAYVGLVPLCLACMTIRRRVAPRSGRSSPRRCDGGDAVLESWPVRARFSLLDRAAGILVFPHRRAGASRRAWHWYSWRAKGLTAFFNGASQPVAWGALPYSRFSGSGRLSAQSSWRWLALSVWVTRRSSEALSAPSRPCRGRTDRAFVQSWRRLVNLCPTHGSRPVCPSLRTFLRRNAGVSTRPNFGRPAHSSRHWRLRRIKAARYRARQCGPRGAVAANIC